MTTVTERFREARDFLLAHREDYATAYEGFSWPRPERFNWALDWFDVIADGNDRTALHIVEEDGSEAKLSFAELSARSDRVAGWLRGRGVRPEDRVLVMLGNQAELWETALAAMKLGAVVIPATPLLGPADLRDRVDRGRVAHPDAEPTQQLPNLTPEPARTPTPDDLVPTIRPPVSVRTSPADHASPAGLRMTRQKLPNPQSKTAICR